MVEKQKRTTNAKRVDFSTVEIREYTMTLGDNPAVSIGPPVCIGETYKQADTLPVEEFEKARKGRRRKPQSLKLRLNYYQRYEILHEAGFEDSSIKAAERGVSWMRTKRKASYYYCFPYVYAGKVRAQLGRSRNKRTLRMAKKNAAKRGE